MHHNDLSSIQNGCLNAVDILESSGLDRRLANMQRDIVTANAGKPALMQISVELAEAISDLPPDAKKIAQEALEKAYGFGIDLFLGNKNNETFSIIRRETIRTDKEYRIILEFVSDTANAAILRYSAQELLVKYEKSKADNA